MYFTVIHGLVRAGCRQTVIFGQIGKGWKDRFGSLSYLSKIPVRLHSPHRVMGFRVQSLGVCVMGVIGVQITHGNEGATPDAKTFSETS